MMTFTKVSSQKVFEGFQNVYKMDSTTLGCETKFSVFLPPRYETKKWPVLWFLSGLTCTEQNFIIKSGFQKFAAEAGFIVVGPDTSPRGCNVAGESDSWDFGVGAGFYLNATKAPFDKNWKMFEFISKELFELVHTNFETMKDKNGVTGFSMGGLGALIFGLKRNDLFKSISAFAPISNPINCPWGQKAFNGYLATEEEWKEWDGAELVKSYCDNPVSILVHQGDADEFLEKQLKPESLVEAAEENANVSVTLKMAPGYDHSFFLVGTFMKEHLDFHVKELGVNV